MILRQHTALEIENLFGNVQRVLISSQRNVGVGSIEHGSACGELFRILRRDTPLDNSTHLFQDDFYPAGRVALLREFLHTLQPLQHTATALWVDQVVGGVLGGKTPQPVGFSLYSPSCLICVEDCLILDFRHCGKPASVRFWSPENAGLHAGQMGSHVLHGSPLNIFWNTL
jgi:hypothetical protein